MENKLFKYMNPSITACRTWLKGGGVHCGNRVQSSALNSLLTND